MYPLHFLRPSLLVIDAKTSYLDDAGKPLSGGRIRYFAYNTTTPVAVYADKDYQTSLGSVVALTGAGWTSTCIHSTQSITAHVDCYLGMDEYGAESYEEVKVYDYVADVGSGSGSSENIVDRIEDLRAVVPAIGLVVTVKAYYTLGDCPIRQYRWDGKSSASDNSGTVIEGYITPVGRWVMVVEGPYVDCRMFGVVNGSSPTTSNSAFSNLFAYCEQSKKTAYFPTGVYYLTSGGSVTANCAIKSDKDCKIYSNNGLYTLTISNPDLTIFDTFAATNLKLILSGSGWEETIVPISAWNVVTRGYSEGSALFNLRISSSAVYVFTGSVGYSSIIVDDGIIATLSGGSITVDHISGSGQISFQSNPTFITKTLNTSSVLAYTSQVMAQTIEKITVDSAVTLHNGCVINAYVESNGGTVTWSSGSAVSMLGGYGGKHNFILGSTGVNVGYHSIVADFFASSNGLVQTYNISVNAPRFLDMQGSSSTETITRTGYIKNGTVAGVNTTDIKLENMTINSRIIANSMILRDCKVNNSQVQALRFVDLQTVTFSGNIDCYESCIMRDVTCANAYMIPLSGTLRNIFWDGGQATLIRFDSTQAGSDGSCIAYNINVQNLRYLPSGIESVNGSTKKWAVNGHYNIIICNNENSKSTIGAGRYTTTQTGTGAYGGKTMTSSSVPSTDLFVFKYGNLTDGLLNAKSLVASNASQYAGDFFWLDTVGGQLNSSSGTVLGVRAIPVANNPTMATGTYINLNWDIYPIR